MKSILFGALAVLLHSGASAQAVQYTIDPMHTYPSFEADHMGISMWRGKLNKSAGKVTLDRTAKQGTVEVTMELASIDFGLDAMNKWARGKDFFNVAKNPKAVYKGKLVDFSEAGPTRALGELTLNGITRPVELKLNAFKCVPHPMFKRELCGADAQAVFNRDEFGLAAGKEYGFRMDVALRIQVEAVADK